MAKKRIQRRRKKSNRKVKENSDHRHGYVWTVCVQTKALPTDDAPDDSAPMEEAGLVTKTLKERGMKRFVRQILSISGEVVMKDQIEFL